MKIHLITGGSGSGKSAWGESWIAGEAKGRPLIYIATMRPQGEEAQKRILRHRRQRAGRGFQTVECPEDLEKLKIPAGSGVLLECLSNLAANELYEEDGRVRDRELVKQKILRGLRRLAGQAEVLAIVTNEIFSDSAEYGEDIRVYQELLGELNREAACMADQVTEVVYGIPVVVK